MENNIEKELRQLNYSLGEINLTLNKLVENSKKDKITFNVEGDKLIGELNNFQKRIFRTKND